MDDRHQFVQCLFLAAAPGLEQSRHLSGFGIIHRPLTVRNYTIRDPVRSTVRSRTKMILSLPALRNEEVEPQIAGAVKAVQHQGEDY